MEAILAIAALDDQKTGKLLATIHVAIGMKAMVLLNIATEADIANGTQGVIQDIVLDEREDALLLGNIMGGHDLRDITEVKTQVQVRGDQS
jgi:hypothetical protein